MMQARIKYPSPGSPAQRVYNALNALSLELQELRRACDEVNSLMDRIDTAIRTAQNRVETMTSEQRKQLSDLSRVHNLTPGPMHIPIRPKQPNIMRLEGVPPPQKPYSPAVSNASPPAVSVSGKSSSSMKRTNGFIRLLNRIRHGH